MVRLPNIVGALAVVILMSGTVCAGNMMNTKASLAYSGPYIGAFVGHSWVDLEYTEPEWPAYDRDVDMEGFVGGLYVGYNYMIDNIVLGVEADAGLGDLEEGPDEDNFYNDYAAFDVDWDAHLRARAGFVYNSTLFYVAGGLALAEVSVDEGDNGNDDATHVGWTIGGGIEQKISEHLTARFEYLYDDYGSESAKYNEFGLIYEGKVALKTHTARIGLAYSF